MDMEIQIKAMGNVVERIQQFLNKNGYIQPISGFFGPITLNNVMRYQQEHDLEKTGSIDDPLLSIITAPDKVDTWCHAIQKREGFFAPGENRSYPKGTVSWKNNNPGNLKWASQEFAYKDGNFAHFPDYQTGYNALRNLLIRACTDQIPKYYHSNMSLYQFYERYAPSSDNNDPHSYASEVAKALGLPVETPIKNLLS